MRLWAAFLTITAAFIVAAALARPHSSKATNVTEVVHRNVTVSQLPAASATPHPELLPLDGRARTVQIGA